MQTEHISRDTPIDLSELDKAKPLITNSMSSYESNSNFQDDSKYYEEIEKVVILSEN